MTLALDTLKHSPLLSAFLTHRGYTAADLSYLLHPDTTHQHDPFLMRGMNQWVDRLHMVKGQTIAIIPDYDADGVLSGTVARVGLSVLGFGDAYVYPPKTADGYGLTKRSVDAVLKAQPDTTVIVTTDNGSNAHDGIAYAKEQGLTVLVTDHHLAATDPVADAVVNPNRQAPQGFEETYPFTHISGTTVIYKALQAYARKYAADGSAMADLETLVVLVGASAISDVMPMRDENRYYVTQAVSMLEQLVERHTPQRVGSYGDTPIEQYFRGLDLLVYSLNRQGKLKYGINADTFGFVIGPILNSPRRMLGDSAMAFDLFLTTREKLLHNPNNDNNEPVSDLLYQINEDRKAYVRTLTTALVKRIETDCETGASPVDFSVFNIVAIGGVAGLLAGSYVTRYDLPSIAFTVHLEPLLANPVSDLTQLINVDAAGEMILSGSGRAPEWFDLHGFLTHIDETYPGLLHKWGGHAQAAGVSIQAKNFDAFRKIFIHGVREYLLEATQDAGRPLTAVDQLSEFVLADNAFEHWFAQQGQALPEAVTTIQVDESPIMTQETIADTVRLFDQMAPFGQGFKAPVFTTFVPVGACRLFYMGAEKQHVKMTLPNGLAVIQWNGADELRPVPEGEEDDRQLLVTGSLTINEYNGNESLQLIADVVVSVTNTEGINSQI